MAANLLTCPHCRGSLKSNKTPPLGVDVLCPKCKKFFKVTNAMVAVPAGVAANGVQARRSPSPPRPGVLDEPAAESRPAASRSFLRPGVLLGGGVAVLALAMLVVWLLSAGDAAKKKNNEPPKEFSQDPSAPSGPAIKIDFTQPAVAPPKPQVVRKIEGLSDAESELVISMQSKGIDFLRKSQKPDGSWPSNFAPGFYGSIESDLAAFCGLTMLECGVPAGDPQIVKAADFVRKNARAMFKTYGVSLYILFLDRLNDPADKPIINRLALQLMNGQLPNGNWEYLNPPLSDVDAQVMKSWLKEIGKNTWAQFSAANPRRAAELPPQLRKVAVFQTDRNGPISAFKAKGGDHSNTQFALLALWAARRQKDVPVDLSLGLIVKRFEAMRNPDGSWSYARWGFEPPVVSMTCAGLLATALGYGLDLPNPAKTPLQDPNVQKGLQFVAKSIPSLDPNPSVVPPRPPIYALWSIERVGVLFDLKTIEGKDWYRWGVRILQGHQKPDGSWQFPPSADDGFSSCPDTCFALLFLHRANLVQDLTDKFSEMTGPSPGQPPMIRKE